jgi:hypothetical protein
MAPKGSNISDYTSLVPGSAGASANPFSFAQDIFNPLAAFTGALASPVQALMGTKQSSTSSSRLQARPEDLAAAEAIRKGIQTTLPDYLKQLGTLQTDISTGVQAAPSSFAFQMSPDAITRGLAAQATQGMAQQAAAQRAQIASQFRGQPGQSNVLQRLADVQTRLQQNPLLFQAFQQQQARELSQAQQNQAARESANQAALQRAMGMANLGTTGLTQQQNILELLNRMAEQYGTRINEQSQRSGGILGNLGIV